MEKKEVRQYHCALRENWEGSAPMVFPDERLTLFGVTEDVPENLTYLVWAKDDAEPEVWCYMGLASHEFSSLESFLNWRLERE
ncbi:MAG: hypothetical protein H6824_04125 [Planctomycetaceae bacterium]|nr:hypothetical protein [Planctomycetaceae bacterium]